MEVLTHTQMNSHCHVWLPQGLVERWTSGVLSASGFSQKLWSTSNMIPTIIMSETISLGQMKNWPRYEHNTIWLFNSSPWKITMLLIGKPSISMGHLYHGYVSHNQRVTLFRLDKFRGFSCRGLRGNHQTFAYKFCAVTACEGMERLLVTGYPPVASWKLQEALHFCRKIQVVHNSSS